MISLTIKGKEVFCTKDIIFFVVAGFMMGFIVASGIYTDSKLLSALLVSPILIMLVICVLKLVKTLQENVMSVDEYAKLKKSNENMFPPPIKVSKPSKKFFEA